MILSHHLIVLKIVYFLYHYKANNVLNTASQTLIQSIETGNKYKNLQTPKALLMIIE